MIIGITGASGSGKSIASECFEKIGYKIVDLDKITHEIYKTDKECVNEVKKAFGDEIIDENGDIIRKKLGEIVFCDKEKLNILNKIVHKYILKKALKEIKEVPDVIVDAPLLFESGLDKVCDITLGIISQRDKNAKRIQVRDNISIELAKSRLDKQYDDSFFKAKCSFCIENNGSIEEFLDKINLFIKNEVTGK